MTAEQQELAANNMGLVPYIVKQYFSRLSYFERDDLYSIGYYGLCKAARDFDPERGCKFATVAAKYIRMQILDAIQKATRQSRDVRKCATTVDQPAPSKKGRDGDTIGTLIVAVDHVETIADAKLLIGWLDDQCGKDARIIRLYIAGYTQGEIAAQVGLTQSGVSRHLSAAKERIREYYATAI